MALTRVSAHAAILAALDASAPTSDADTLFDRLTADGTLPAGCSFDVFEDLLRELQAERLLSASEPRLERCAKSRPSYLEVLREDSAPESSTTPVARRRALVVEDDPDNAEMLCVVLQAAGFDTLVAQDGALALARAETFRPAVVLIDLGLPDMDGTVVAQRLREQTRFAQTILIAVTGYEGAQHRAQARTAGFDHYLVKPLVFEHLLLVVDQAKTV